MCNEENGFESRYAFLPLLSEDMMRHSMLKPVELAYMIVLSPVKACHNMLRKTLICDVMKSRIFSTLMLILTLVTETHASLSLKTVARHWLKMKETVLF